MGCDNIGMAVALHCAPEPEPIRLTIDLTLGTDPEQAYRVTGFSLTAGATSGVTDPAILAIPNRITVAMSDLNGQVVYSEPLATYTLSELQSSGDWWDGKAFALDFAVPVEGVKTVTLVHETTAAVSVMGDTCYELVLDDLRIDAQPLGTTPTATPTPQICEHQLTDCQRKYLAHAAAGEASGTEINQQAYNGAVAGLMLSMINDYKRNNFGQFYNFKAIAEYLAGKTTCQYPPGNPITKNDQNIAYAAYILCCENDPDFPDGPDASVPTSPVAFDMVYNMSCIDTPLADFDFDQLGLALPDARKRAQPSLTTSKSGTIVVVATPLWAISVQRILSNYMPVTQSVSAKPRSVHPKDGLHIERLDLYFGIVR